MAKNVKLIMLVGLPGSGKSTFTKLLCTSTRQVGVINQDELGRKKCEEIFLREIKKNELTVLDRCNLAAASRKEWLALSLLNKSEIVCVYLATDVDECIHRAQNRKNHPTIKHGGGERIITEAYKKMEPPNETEGFSEVVILYDEEDVRTYLRSWDCFQIEPEEDEHQDDEHEDDESSWNPTIHELSQITDRIYISSHKTSVDRHLLTNHGITHILSILPQGTEAHPDAFTYRIVRHIEDEPSLAHSTALFNEFADSCAFIHSALSDEEASPHNKILIHCKAGKSRSVSVAAAYLMVTTGLGPEQVIGAIQTKRWCASPNNAFRKVLREFYVLLDNQQASLQISGDAMGQMCAELYS